MLHILCRKCKTPHPSQGADTSGPSYWSSRIPFTVIRMQRFFGVVGCKGFCIFLGVVHLEGKMYFSLAAPPPQKLLCMNIQQGRPSALELPLLARYEEILEIRPKIRVLAHQARPSCKACNNSGSLSGSPQLIKMTVLVCLGDKGGPCMSG